ncbi:hypothetical protein B0H15DRAFT_794175 [Mycena belliarum]|uniref:DUF6699 domain-containing protein n=1 Tax=Mycena belliarum TaxID=1033014 RepID=A0AAD6XKT1_9AGAR|nr:hypothetical protein B0H15DRAFT_794175 [Mycena belliae]
MRRDLEPPQSRANAQVVDQVDSFQAGPHYGPVLDPLQVGILRVALQLNPLVHPPIVTGAQPQLNWNMLFPSNTCSCSEDPRLDLAHMSLWTGHHEPATFPPVSRIHLVSEMFPWLITVSAGDPNLGVTLGDLIDCIAHDMHQYVEQADFDALPEIRKQELRHTRRHNRSDADGVPGGSLGSPMLRLDWLGTHAMFGGVRENDALVYNRCGTVLPCSFELVCTARDRVDESPNPTRDPEALSPSPPNATRRDSAGAQDQSEVVIRVDDGLTHMLPASGETFEGREEHSSFHANDTVASSYGQEPNEGGDNRGIQDSGSRTGIGKTLGRIAHGLWNYFW